MKQPLILVACCALAACASPGGHPQDPLEPMNRAVFSFNDKADQYVLKPVAEGYRYITPQPVRTAVGNVFDNLRDVYSLANHALQLEGKKTATDVLRVSINSTFGLFGLIDLATPMGLPSYKATLGDTFAHYGWQQSSYLVLPILGPSTIRDGTGVGLSFGYSSGSWVFQENRDAAAATILYGVASREKLLGLDETFSEAALDRYSYMRDGYLQYRNARLGFTPPASQQNPDDDNIDDLVPEDTPASAPAAAAPQADASAPVAAAPAP
ncbi:VacJ family lipoprotein [Vogesella sp. DC21W]|uniref:VacJ family lipoprotein n=1 Tax=Vogesella aquatica TaxID=2984206 RepID=A0ABT5J1P9_9NEIS|nr:VacJ family lipoprotein [Vogesella aquatica]MDC7718764.1 VacJ family lipoprotein [Vogesella aquatica]